MLTAGRGESDVAGVQSLAWSEDGAMAAALIIVDEQPDFCEGGPLTAQGGNRLAERTAASPRVSGRR